MFRYIMEPIIWETEIDGHPLEMALWWTGAMEDYDRLRPLTYMKSNVILITFAVDMRDSLENVKIKV